MISSLFSHLLINYIVDLQLNEWKRLEDYLAPTDVFDMDDYVCKQWVIFLRTYAMYFG